MNLKEILQKIVDNGNHVILSDNERDWEASELLDSLSDRVLKRQAHMQQGLYIAEINDAGYLGQVLFKVKPKA